MPITDKRLEELIEWAQGRAEWNSKTIPEAKGRAERWECVIGALLELQSRRKDDSWMVCGNCGVMGPPYEELKHRSWCGQSKRKMEQAGFSEYEDMVKELDEG